MSARIHWGDGYVKVFMPTVPDELLKRLRYWHRELKYDPATYQTSASGDYRNLYDLQVVVDDDQTMAQCVLTMPGFMHRVKATLDALNVPYSIVDERTPFPQPNIEAALSGLRDYQWECAYTAILSGGGVVACPTGWGKTHLIGAIVRAFSHDDLCARDTCLSVVTCADREIATQNYDTLRTVLPGRDVGLIMGGIDRPSDDVQVITLDSLHKLNPDDIGILVVDEVHTAATPSRSECIIRARRARIWGASATPTGRFDGGDLLTEGMTGPVIYQRTYQQGVEDGALVPIKVYWINVPEPHIGLQKYNNYKTRRGKYNQAVIHGNVQNDLTVQVLKTMPPELQTLCIMQQTAQMNELVARMDGIRYVHAKTNDKDLQEDGQRNLTGISPKERKQLYDDFRAGKIRQILSTHVYKQGVNFPDLQVLVCPGGGGSEIVAGQIPGRGSRKIEGKDCAYLVDFWHPWDLLPAEPGQKKPKMGPVLKDDRERDRVYENLGFERHWVNSVDELPWRLTCPK